MPLNIELQSENYDAVIVGAGIYGCWIALRLSEMGKKVLLIERREGICLQASLWNQARIHKGYHYPRSVLTALRSRINYAVFKKQFSSAVSEDHIHLYAISKKNSYISAKHFAQFMSRIGAPIRKCSQGLKNKFAEELIEDVFEVQEAVFDARKLAQIMGERLEQAAVTLALDSELVGITRDENGGHQVVFAHPQQGKRSVLARRIFNCTYSNLNGVLKVAEQKPIDLKLELAEIAMVEVPASLKGLGITIMCGPFFSLMPFPSTGLHSLSHVRYTPRFSCQGSFQALTEKERASLKSRFSHMLHDSSRFVPEMKELKYVQSFWAMKALLPQTESSDGRPIYFRPSSPDKSIINVLGGKIDNIFDLSDDLLAKYL